MRHTGALTFFLFLCGLTTSLFAPFGHIPGAKGVIARERYRERKKRRVKSEKADRRQVNKNQSTSQDKNTTDDKTTT